MMKRAHAILLIISLAFTTVYAGPSPADLYRELAQHIKSANVVGLAQYFGSSVEVTIVDREGTYSKSQAKVVLENFFNKNAPADFVLRHNGQSGADDKYAIGILTTKDGAKYRTFMSLKRKDGKYVLQELRFEKN